MEGVVRARVSPASSKDTGMCIVAAVLPQRCSHTPHAAATQSILYIMSRGDHLGQAWSSRAETLHHLAVTNFLTSGTRGRTACT